MTRPGRLEAKAPAEKVVGRAKRAGKRAAASDLERHRAAILQLGVEVKGRHGQFVQVQDDRSVPVSDDLASPPERNSEMRSNRPSPARALRSRGNVSSASPRTMTSRKPKARSVCTSTTEACGLPSTMAASGCACFTSRAIRMVSGYVLQIVPNPKTSNDSNSSLRAAKAQKSILFSAPRRYSQKPVQVDDPGALSPFEHGGQRQDADGSLFRNQTNSFALCQLPVFQIGCRWGADQADSAFRRRLRHCCEPSTRGWPID